MRDGKLQQSICDATGGGVVASVTSIQSVWAGYGELFRCHLSDAPVDTVVVKHVTPPKGRGHAHQRKLRSYEVEAHFYRQHAPRCDDGCRVASCFGAQRVDKGWLLIMEDLDAAGFSGRDRDPRGRRLDATLAWLANFHVMFMHERPRGLWKTGTYWHLATRPDEFAAMADGPLRRAAKALDAKLANAEFQTWVHGDAKPANFCFSRDGRVAAVDFQYVGVGCGIKDVAYLLSGTDPATVERGLDHYFAVFRKAWARRGKPDAEADLIETEWRELYAVAWADFQRFLAGWAPSWRPLRHEAEMTRNALAQLAR